MLFGLLSGFRSARSPLIVGYVVVAALWLLLFHLLPESASGFQNDYPELYRMFSIIGPLGAAAAVSFAAYLVGDLVVRESARILQIRGGTPVESSTSSGRQWLRGRWSITHDPEMDELEDRLEELIKRTITGDREDVDLDQFSDVLADRISTRQGRDLRGFKARQQDHEAHPGERTLNDQVKIEAKSGRIDERILAKNPELFSELSRIRGEAEFRAGLMPALALLYLAVALHVPWPAWLLAGIGAAIVVFEILTFRETFQLRSRARGIALRAILDDLVSTPTLDAIKRERESLLRQQVAQSESVSV